MSLILSIAAETAEHHPDPLIPYIIAGVAFVVFLGLGVVTWSYRDVANRTTRGRTAASSGHDSHAGH